MVLLLNSSGRGGEKQESVLRGERQASSTLDVSGRAQAPVLPSVSHSSSCPSARLAWQDVKQGWAVGGCQSKDDAETGECEGMAETEHKSCFLCSLVEWDVLLEGLHLNLPFKNYY